jgi:DNA-binding MurR/RpiR family transcriptional regulator
MGDTQITLTIAERIRSQFNNLTKSERQLADVILKNYPISGLGSITNIAKTAVISTPTVMRMAKKLGFSGFPEFQTQLHVELEETISNPISKHERWAAKTSNSHILNRFTEAVMENLSQTIKQLDVETFDEVTKLLSDSKREIYVVGGRITHSLADYFFVHMQVMRDGLSLMNHNANVWPHNVINMQSNDLLIIFDIRRYETDLLRLAEMAKERKVKIILFTDQWKSPVAKYAHHTFQCRIEVPSAWDSTIAITFILEALLSAVQSETWDNTKERIKTLEGLFDYIKLFEKSR